MRLFRPLATNLFRALFRPLFPGDVVTAMIDENAATLVDAAGAILIFEDGE